MTARPGASKAPAHDREDTLTALTSLRDWLRYAVSRFNAAELSYGHGTANALDEAAFLILHTLALPIDMLEPWLDAHLTRSERESVLAIVEERISTRKPAPYLVGAAYIKGHRFHVDERVIVPRSYIGELLAEDGLAAVVADPARVGRVLELCTGSGCLAILAAHAFPDAAIDAVDLSAEALEVAKVNVAAHGMQDRINLLHGDLFAPVEGKTYDLLIANPPYVARAEMAAFPPEHRAEPAIAHDGGADGLDLVRRILAGAGRFLAPQGVLVMEIGTGRELIEAAYPGLPFLWLDTADSEGELLALDAAQLCDPKPRTAGARKKRRT